MSTPLGKIRKGGWFQNSHFRGILRGWLTRFLIPARLQNSEPVMGGQSETIREHIATAIQLLQSPCGEKCHCCIGRAEQRLRGVLHEIDRVVR